MGYSPFWKAWYIPLSTFDLDLGFSKDDELKQLWHDALTDVFSRFYWKSTDTAIKAVENNFTIECMYLQTYFSCYSKIYQPVCIPRWKHVDGDASKLLIDCFEVALF